MLGSNIFCGASLVTDRHLVTAAHCLAGVEPGLFSMVDILLRHYGGPGAGAAVRRKMEAVTIHPAFNEDTLQNDIAVVRLRRPVSIAPGAVRGQQKHLTSGSCYNGFPINYNTFRKLLL